MRLARVAHRSVKRGFSWHRSAGAAVVFASLMGSTPSKSAGMAMSTESSASATPVLTRDILQDKIKGMYYGLLAGDSLSMPYHWFYSPSDITRYHGGEVRDFVRAPDSHPGSIMSLSSTGGAGRGQQKGSVIGDVINKGKKHLWGRRGIHYHHGMAAGENTLNALCARLVVRSMARTGGYSAEGFLEDYVEFMTTKGTHNDTYAESYHRMFFANWANGVPPSKCADDDGHNIATMGGFVTLPPVAAAAALRAGVTFEGPAATVDLKAARAAGGKAARAHVLLTHRSDFLADHAELYGQLLAGVLLGQDLKAEAAAAGKELGADIPSLADSRLGDTDVVGRRFSPACYIHDAFRGLCFFAHRYAGSVEEALVANTNAGGENCHRGAALGAVVGAALGMGAGGGKSTAGGVPARWAKGLAAATAIEREAEELVVLALGPAAGAATGGEEEGAASAAGGGGGTAVGKEDL